MANSVEMLSGRRKKDYAAEIAQALETQVEVMGLDPLRPDDYAVGRRDLHEVASRVVAPGGGLTVYPHPYPQDEAKLGYATDTVTRHVGLVLPPVRGRG